MSAVLSALGAEGMGSLIGTVGSIIGNINKGKTSAHAESDTVAKGVQNIQDSGSSTQNSTSRGTEATSGWESTSGYKLGSSKSKQKGNTTEDFMRQLLSSISTNEQTTAKSTQRGKEQFSGQQNIRSSGLDLSNEGMIRIMNLMLQGDAGIKGLAEVAGGERKSGLYDSSTNQQLLDNLMTTVTGEVAKLVAPTVERESLGETTVAKDLLAESISDMISKAVQQSSESGGTSGYTSASVEDQSSSSEAGGKGYGSTTTSDISQLITEAFNRLSDTSTTQQSNTVQDMNSKTKSKSGIFGLF